MLDTVCLCSKRSIVSFGIFDLLDRFGTNQVVDVFRTTSVNRSNLFITGFLQTTSQ